MKAEILPLEGKYYGTKIIIIDGKENTLIEIWHSDGHDPSKRQLEQDGYNNVEKWKNDDCGCDSHYESDWTYKLANIIIEAVNEKG